MHTRSIALLFLSSVCAFSQTQFLRVTNVGKSTNYISLPANTTADCIGFFESGVAVYCDNGFGFKPVTMFWSAPPASGVVLGPSSIQIVSTTNATTVWKLETVNTAPLASLVAPAGATAVLSVETSTNLSTWQTVTNAAFPKADAHRFFRTRLTVQ